MKTVSDCIGIREYLLRRGLQPHRETATHGMFLSPLREERTPSFSVRYDKGLWYDFGLGEGGTLLQLVMRIEGCGMAEAIRHLRKEAANEVLFQPLPTASPREDSPLRILSVGEIRHPALIGYLRERGIDPAVAGALCREVHYAVGERRFFAIGFRNDAGGWELRSPQFKGSSAPKTITTFDRHGDTALLFNHQPDAFALHHWYQFALQITSGDGVIGLQRRETGQTQSLGNAQRFGDLPCGPVRDTDVAHVAVLHQLSRA